MYINGDFAENKKHFSEVYWGPATAHYVARAEGMDSGRWAEVFRSLNDVLAKKRQVEHASHGGPRPSETRRLVPESDTESVFLDNPSENEVGGGEGIPLPVTCNLLG